MAATSVIGHGRDLPATMTNVRSFGIDRTPAKVLALADEVIE